MPTSSELLQNILTAATQQGLDQAQLAAKAKVRPETISRAKKRDTADIKTLQSLAHAAGLELQLQPLPSKNTAPTSPLAHPRFGLAWSNPNASAEALVCNAIKSGNYHLLLNAAVGHGLVFLRQQFNAIAPTLRAQSRKEIKRKLGNIERGFSHAQA
jgi:transcriptional regulator with XRE-family HTH domain